MSNLEKFSVQIFEEHFGDVYFKEGTNPFQKYFSEIRKWVILNIKDALIKEVPEKNYEEYMSHDETYEINLLDELTPFISNKISIEILSKYQSNGYFNSQNVSDIYFYHIPDEVVEDIIKLKNNNILNNV